MQTARKINTFPTSTDLDGVQFDGKGAYIETDQYIKLFLQRQGVSETLNCSHPKFFVEIGKAWDRKHHAEIFYSNDHNTYNRHKAGQIYKTDYNTGGEQPSLRFIAKHAAKLAGKPVFIMDQRLSYMYGWKSYDYQDTDLILSKVHYCEYSDTIRVTKENYCLVHFENGQFDQAKTDMDGATIDLRHYVDKALSKGFHQCDLDKGQDYCKRRLAWLIGAYMGDDLTGARFCNQDMTKLS